MTYRFCHRCQADLPPHDEGTLIFCSNCGAPQILLSEDLQSQVEMQAQAALDGSDAGLATPDPRSFIWSGAIRCAALAGAVAAGLACLTAIFPPALFLTMLWAFVGPVVVLGLFQTRFPLAPITTSFGARLGLLTGISVASALSVVSTITLLLSRFRFHTMGDFDAQWTVQLEQLKERSAADVLPLIKMYALPEFRAGIMISGIAFAIVMLLITTTLIGAFAGFVRSRPKA